MHEKSVADEIAQISMERPHVVLVGAGASRAALPVGDRNGRALPVMSDFMEVVPVKDILIAADIPFEGRNFEEVYAGLAAEHSKTAYRIALEDVVADYFSSLALPDSPTIYDHLVLSLRAKDVIATFNWDPFLIQAVRRNRRVTRESPKLLFLHGNVLQGYCEHDQVQGLRGADCRLCGEPLKPVRLLYPIGEKDYESDGAIRLAWDAIKWAFESAFMVTIFGYGAPQSDRSAVALLQTAWGPWKDRAFEQFDIIDIRNEDSLLQSWKGFIHTHHYQVHQRFSDSWLANNPRRTGEAYHNQYLEAAFIEDNPIPQFARLDELWRWFEPLLEAERARKP